MKSPYRRESRRRSKLQHGSKRLRPSALTVHLTPNSTYEPLNVTRVCALSQILLNPDFGANVISDLNGLAAARIRAVRESSGLSQGQLAARAGLSRPSLANIEAGRQTITVRQLGAIALALDVRAADLLI